MTAAGPQTDGWRVYGPRALPAPLEAALTAFAEHGYDGTSVRDIAGRAGLSVPGLYHHYPSKQSLLQGLLDLTMRDLLERSEQALAQAGTDPVARFDALVESLLRFHMARQQQAFIASSEIRSIDEDYRTTYIGHRDREQRMVDDAIIAGVASGDFTTASPRGAGRAITTMCIGVSSWYRPDGPMSPDEVVAENLGFARAIVGYAPR
ncbi:TetR/AcrR family transcriptional regulator [Gordonia sp. (in: high G+C Gram-positive bacteria)]|uniref:TetR/AcrR family transcriptional regulator n=1 Tax=Gordonia sp. (in: high G+C Gram-positive bacteria) TaxID=84139 RepID=UPI0039E2F369